MTVATTIAMVGNNMAICIYLLLWLMAMDLYLTVALYSMLQLDHPLLLQPPLPPPYGFGYDFGHGFGYRYLVSKIFCKYASMLLNYAILGKPYSLL